MSVASLGALVAGVCAALAASLNDSASIIGLVYSASLLIYICTGTVTLVRREFYAQDRISRRWRLYGLGGATLGVVVIAYNFTTFFQGAIPLPSRWTAFVFATAIILLTASAIVRYYILPLNVAIQAAFRMRHENQVKLVRKLTNGDHKLADEVSQALDLALRDDS